MYTIRKEFAFSASHYLTGLPGDHPCSRLHGHNYTVALELQLQDVVPPGWVFDYRNLDCVKEWIDDVIDHRDLNEVFQDINPTAENLARKIYDSAHNVLMAHGHLNVPLVRVGVSETPKTWAYFYQDRVTASAQKLANEKVVGI